MEAGPHPLVGLQARICLLLRTQQYVFTYIMYYVFMSMYLFVVCFHSELQFTKV